VPVQPRILVINSGSSSLKYSVIDLGSKSALANGIAERLGTPDACIEFTGPTGHKQTASIPRADHGNAAKRAIELLASAELGNITAIGHRVVHGGEYFRQPTRISPDVLAKIDHLADLAPLHNPSAAKGIRIVTQLFPQTPQVAVFDTAFHQTLPEYAFHYAIPFELYQKYRIRRYGFHGTSHHYVGMQAAERLGQPFDQVQLLSAHLGNGCSATAIRLGRSVDTTMGLTPSEGLVMGTRSGDVDPSLHAYLQEKTGMSLTEITEILTRRSGLLGVSGIGNDMRTVLAAADQGNSRAQLAVELFCYRLGRALLGLSAGLTSIDALIFTGGIGENSPRIRRTTLNYLAILHPSLQSVWNDQNGKNSHGRITSGEGLVCLVIPTNEELMIAQQTFSCIDSAN
jgi:acetate kinase